MRFGPVKGGPDAAAKLLEPMKPLDIEPRGRDVGARVTRFDEEAFAALSRAPGVERAEAAPMPLEEILIAVATAGERSG